MNAEASLYSFRFVLFWNEYPWDLCGVQSSTFITQLNLALVEISNVMEIDER